jgi:hypothetical protein
MLQQHEKNLQVLVPEPDLDPMFAQFAGASVQLKRAEANVARRRNYFKGTNVFGHFPRIPTGSWQFSTRVMNEIAGEEKMMHKSDGVHSDTALGEAQFLVFPRPAGQKEEYDDESTSFKKRVAMLSCLVRRRPGGNLTGGETSQRALPGR